MRFSNILVIAGFTSVANAHFRLLFPEPRGVFVADQEPNYCGGYTNAVSNRSIFPLSGGFFSIKTGHPSWTAGVLLSTVQNPTSFDNFSSGGQQQLASPFAKQPDAGTFCVPLNLSAANISGVKDGANVTIQIVFAGGDGNLYQCADLTLSSTYSIPSNISCANTTATSSSASTTPTLPSSSQTGGSLGRAQASPGYAAAMLLLASMALPFV